MGLFIIRDIDWISMAAKKIPMVIFSVVNQTPRMSLLRLLASIVLISPIGPIAVAGDVAAEIHKLCIKAVDYRGCVEAQAGTPQYLGNKCPSNHAYIGDGYCQRVYCDWVGLGGGHHEPLSLVSQPGVAVTTTTSGRMSFRLDSFVLVPRSRFKKPAVALLSHLKRDGIQVANTQKKTGVPSRQKPSDLSALQSLHLSNAIGTLT